MIQLLTRIEGLEVESMHKEDRIKVLVKKIQLLEGVQAYKMELMMGEGDKMEVEKVEWEKGKTSTEKECHSAREGLEVEEATVRKDQCASAE